MVGKRVCEMQDVIVVLRVEGKMTLFAIFPMGATMQDGGKRKRSNATCITVTCNIILNSNPSFKYKAKNKRKRKNKQSLLSLILTQLDSK